MSDPKPNGPLPESTPTPRIPGLNYDDPVFPDADDSDWMRNEGFVQGFAESIEHRILHGKGADRAAAFDMAMRHEAAEINREVHKFTGASIAQIQNAEFWRGLAPCRTAMIDVALFTLHFEHDGELMIVSARFPADVADGFTACGHTYERLVESITSELREWCRLNKPNLTV